MQRSTKILAATLCTLVLGLSSAAWARGGMGMGMGCGPQALNLDPQQTAQVFDLRHKFMNDTAALRKDMAVKRAELAALWRQAEPDQKQILAKEKELNALRSQMQEKSLAFRMEMRKYCPKGAEGQMACPGMGPGHGMGRGMGPCPKGGPGI